MGAVDAQFHVAVGFEHGFHAPPLFELVRGGGGVVFRHKAGVPVGDPVGAEEPPCDGDGIGGGVHLFDQMADMAAPAFDGQEFIRIHRQNPVTVGDIGVLGGQHQRVGLGLFAFGDVIAEMFDPAQFLKPDQHVIGAVTTVVGVDTDVIEADVFVIGDPFHKAVAFVLHHRQDRKLMFRHQLRPRRSNLVECVTFIPALVPRLALIFRIRPGLAAA